MADTTNIDDGTGASAPVGPAGNGAVSTQVRALVVLRGVLVLAFGLAVLLTPGLALLALIFVFAAYALVDGVAAIVLGIRHRAERPGWGWTVAQGVVSVIAGVVAFTLPASAAIAILFVIAFWAIMAGVVTAISANEVRKHGGPWGWIAGRAALDVLFGVLLLVWPASGILALLWLIGAFAVASGIVLIAQAFRSQTHPAIG
ncbi:MULTISPECIES: HdeD family acid-resistance protein [Pseudonocardia]|uniref:Acid-resistance membrane protein n=2 Tax=Pseudonocardia TaxID=1847 RepID=A0A1Y2N2M5_PSEAH|nr:MULTISPECIES: DUF308 domain-containing protein [Pseudonocardia]OSY41702.1 hypothetical protein BG845_01730 [Pseudonocardia autotrophica]TDN71246.1 uncharacterized membrane protein HdeD (DUF308 family) [Pseudonocardia autotrophica]BBG01918.1 membrane protein [Pseudonocardia autotrophica]GEC23083.1 membrane protein [Pseudonocardia saturnea]